MINWILSIICVVLLVMIVHRLLGAMHLFYNLQTALNDRELAEPLIPTDAMLETSSLLSSHSTELTSDHPTTISLAPADEDDAKPLYIASRRGTRFHREDCSSVKRIQEANRQYFHRRDEAVESGYEPCNICNP
ncbi:MAG: hypothetical protein GX176_07150 [Syntrophomonadaceae bacterium]|jgi:hypothetical protein|nr:hypothetical protein [Syntrophomonadaceae bacterium]HQA49787.1 Ada metal-binding domain-containing protein [Syntrophomonadaceae bacterium]HQD90927.1 Ada metal-binding domain-containing protein [Syntrophomonadaceae bacterium]